MLGWSGSRDSQIRVKTSRILSSPFSRIVDDRNIDSACFVIGVDAKVVDVILDVKTIGKRVVFAKSDCSPVVVASLYVQLFAVLV